MQQELKKYRDTVTQWCLIVTFAAIGLFYYLIAKVEGVVEFLNEHEFIGIICFILYFVIICGIWQRLVDRKEKMLHEKALEELRKAIEKGKIVVEVQEEPKDHAG